MSATNVEAPADHERDWASLRPVLDQELASLPEKYRLPLVLCDLEGRTQEDAAKELAVPRRTLAHRLERARLLLRKRLEHRGIALSVTVLAALVTSHSSHAALSATFVASTVKAASFAFAGNLAASGMASSHAVSLAQQAVEMLFWSKLKAAGVACVLTALVGLTGVTSYLAIAQGRQGKDTPPRAEAPAVTAVAPEPPPAITVTWNGGSALHGLRRGLKVFELGDEYDWRPRPSVPPELRFKPVDGRKLVEAVAAGCGLKVAWLHDGAVAIVYRGASDEEVEQARKDFGSADPSVRRDAVWRAHWFRDVRTVPLLVNAVKDKDAVVARQALLGLRRWQSWNAILAIDGRAAELIADQMDDPDANKRCDAAVALGGIGGEKALALVEKGLTDQEIRVRWCAAEALGSVGGEKAMARLENMLADPDPSMRWEAAMSLGRAGGEKARALLERTLGDRSAMTRVAAADQLGSAGGEKVLAVLEDAAADPDWDTRYVAAKAMARFGGDRGLAIVEKALAGKDENLRSCVAKDALSYLKGEKAFAFLEEALANPDRDVRYGAASALGSNGELARLEKALADPDVNVRGSAAYGLGYVGTEKALALIEKALSDPEYEVRCDAAYGLGGVGGEKALALLEKACADPVAQVRTGAIESLGSAGTARALAHFEKALADDGANVCGCAIRMLGNVGGEKAVVLLEKALVRKDSYTRECAAGALGNVGGARACASLLAALKTGKDAKVRAAIVKALKSEFADFPGVQEVLKNLPVLPGEKPGEQPELTPLPKAAQPDVQF